jgi:hypothetical protein
MVIDSLLDGPKKPAEIERDLYEKAKRRYDSRYDLSEEQKKERIAKDTIKIRYIEYILNSLQEDEEVTQKNAFGKYFLTDRLFNNPDFVASIFGRNAVSKLIELNALSRNPFVRLDDDNFEEDYIDAESLFRFANNVGALITYVMLDAMNPEYTKHLQKGADKDELVMKRIDNAIGTEGFLWGFCKLQVIKRGQAVGTPVPISESLPPAMRDELLKRQKRSRFFDPHNPRWSRYEMDDHSFQKAIGSFARAYPDTYALLEKMKRDIPNTISWYKKSYRGSVRRDREKRRKK